MYMVHTGGCCSCELRRKASWIQIEIPEFEIDFAEIGATTWRSRAQFLCWKLSRTAENYWGGGNFGRGTVQRTEKPWRIRHPGGHSSLVWRWTTPEEIAIEIELLNGKITKRWAQVGGRRQTERRGVRGSAGRLAMEGRRSEGRWWGQEMEEK